MGDGPMNLLDHFVMQHVQCTLLHAELQRAAAPEGTLEARVELNLTPRLVEASSGDGLPAYRVSARLRCEGDPDEELGPVFSARVAMEAIYQQVSGDAMDVTEFTGQHVALARQLYPLLQQQLRELLARLGLAQIQLPYDLAPRAVQPGSASVELSSSVH